MRLGSCSVPSLVSPLVALSLAIAATPVEHGEAFVWTALKFAKQMSAATLGSLSLQEAAAIHIYTMGWNPPESSLYAILNRSLRNVDRAQLLPYLSYLRLLLTGMSKLPVFVGNVWRGVKADLSTQCPKGKKFFWWGFSSCTTDMKALESDLFLGKDGKHTLFNIENCTRAAEVLLLPGTYLEVVNVGDMGHGLVIISLCQIKPPFKMLDHERETDGKGNQQEKKVDAVTQADVDTAASEGTWAVLRILTTFPPERCCR